MNFVEYCLEKGIGKNRGFELMEMMADSERVHFGALIDYAETMDLTWEQTLDVCLDILASSEPLTAQSPEDIRRKINQYGLATVAEAYGIPVDELEKYKLHIPEEEHTCTCGNNEDLY